MCLSSCFSKGIPLRSFWLSSHHSPDIPIVSSLQKCSRPSPCRLCTAGIKQQLVFAPAHASAHIASRTASTNASSIFLGRQTSMGVSPLREKGSFCRDRAERTWPVAWRMSCMLQSCLCVLGHPHAYISVCPLFLLSSLPATS